MPRNSAEERRAQINEVHARRESQEFVRYIGPSHIRSMTQEDLHLAGFSGTDLVDLRWDQSNNWTVPREKIPDEVYEQAIKPDLELVLVGKDGERLL